MQGTACAQLDLVSRVYEAVDQIPVGMVSTYGDIASALGDKIAAKAVWEVLNRYPAPPGLPKHRVVHADGRLGAEGEEGEVIEGLLTSEGVEVTDGTVGHMRSRRFAEFHVDPVLRSLRAEQDAVRERVIEHDDFGDLQHVAGLDVSYSGRRAFAAVAIYDARTGDEVDKRTSSCDVRFPYIPTYLSYRELPVLRPLVTERTGTIYLVDGHGALHPRGAGIASHLGVALDVPTVGAAKSALVGEVGKAVNGRAPVLLDGRVRGYRLGLGPRSTFVSVGHRVSLATAVEVCERFLVKGIPSPLRRAHDLAGLTRRSSE
jgi:deoxyribonuclease V